MAGLQLHRGDPDELERYTRALKFTFEEECVKENDAPSCHRLAEFFQSVEKNLDRANELYRANCENRCYGNSCFSLGVQYFVGSGVKKDLDEGRRLFEKGCEYGCGESCNNAGMSWRSGKGTPDSTVDMKKAEEFFVKGCDRNDARSCFNLSTLYLTGSTPEGSKEGAITQDMAKAFEYASRACKLGHMYGCINAARQSETGDGVDADPRKAEYFKKRARDLKAGIVQH